MNDEKLFAETLLAGCHSLEALRAEFGALPGEDGELNLAEVDPSQLENHRGSKVRPIPGVKLYLQSGDDLTNQAINSMELAMEKAYQVQPPFFITTMRDGEEAKKSLQVRYFYLDRE